MKNSMKLFAMTALVVIAAMSTAQGRGMQMFGRGGGSMAMLLARDDVAKEIKLTSDQQTKLGDQRQAMMDNMRAQFQNGGGGDRDAMRKQMTEMMAKAEKDALALLDDGQKKRLKELWIQRSGNTVIANDDMQKELGLTEDQKSKVKALVDAQNTANQEIFQKVQNGEIDRQEVRPLMEKNQKTLGEELGKVLTSEQADKLKSMRGAEFKFDEDNGGF